MVQPGHTLYQIWNINRSHSAYNAHRIHYDRDYAEFEGHADIADIVIEVSDDGEGIPRENLEAIFTDFFSTRDQGTGLGLSNVRRLAAEEQIVTPPTIDDPAILDEIRDALQRLGYGGK